MVFHNEAKQTFSEFEVNVGDSNLKFDGLDASRSGVSSKEIDISPDEIFWDLSALRQSDIPGAQKSRTRLTASLSIVPVNSSLFPPSSYW